MTDTTRTPGSHQPEPIAFDERTRRVFELRRRVREGTYRPDPAEVARAILSEWFAMGLELEREELAPAVQTAAERHEVAARFVVRRTETAAESTETAQTA